MNLENVTTQLRDFARGRQDIAALYLFGSQVTGQARSDSDIDVAVLACHGNGKDWLDFEIKLEAALSQQVTEGEIEVLVLNRATVSIQFEVISTGKLVWSNDEEFRTNWTVKMLGDHWDIRPFLKEYDRVFFERLKKGFTDAQWRAYYRARATLTGTHQVSKAVPGA